MAKQRVGVTVVDARFDPDRLMFDRGDVEIPEWEPTYTISEVSKFFFGRTTHWLRWREQAGHTRMPDDRRPTVSRTAADARKYSLAQIERLAHALHIYEDIETPQLRETLDVIRAEAILWGYFPAT